jgi:hypothetical protein
MWGGWVAARLAAVLTVLLLLTGVVTACASDEANPSPTVPGSAHEALDAVDAWLGHLAAGDDDRAFTDLAPRSQAAVGDLANYRRGRGRFTPIYERFAGTTLDPPLRLADALVVVTLQRGDAVAAVPVRRVDGTWRVEPLLDVASFSHEPDDGTEVDARPTVTLQLDDPQARATMWFDGHPASADSTGMVFRPRRELRPGAVVVTFAITRGDDVVARAFQVRVAA